MTTAGTVPTSYSLPRRVGSIDQGTYMNSDMNRALLICERCGAVVTGAGVPVHNSWHTNNALLSFASTALVTALRLLM